MSAACRSARASRVRIEISNAFAYFLSVSRDFWFEFEILNSWITCRDSWIREREREREREMMMFFEF